MAAKNTGYMKHPAVRAQVKRDRRAAVGGYAGAAALAGGSFKVKNPVARKAMRVGAGASFLYGYARENNISRAYAGDPHRPPVVYGGKASHAAVSRSHTTVGTSTHGRVGKKHY